MTQDKQQQLDELYAAHAEIPGLQEVRRGRDPVRGSGPLSAPLVVVGEAPGEDEEREGRPFVGRSGQLLQELFKKAGIPWELCYVTNVIPWRPEGNRTPYPFEVMASWERVEREIKIVGPYVVVTAGTTAWNGVTRKQGPDLSQARYKLTSWDGYRLLAIHHPAHFLRMSSSLRAGAEKITVGALQSIFPDNDEH